MKLSQLIELSRARVPQFKVSANSDSLLTLVLNQATLDVAARLSAMKGIGNFNAVEDQEQYTLSEELNGFLTVDAPGVWFKDGTQFKQLDPYTMKALDEDYPTWRNADSGTPQRYAMYGDIFISHPPPNLNKTNGFRIYFVKHPIIMSNNDHYPFHQPSDQNEERVDLSILSETIILFSESKMLEILGKKEESMLKFNNEYLVDIEVKRGLLQRRPDVMAGRRTRLRGRAIA